MKNVILTTLIVLMIIGLYVSSFALGAMDGCADAGYDTFAIGEYGIYCLNSESFTPLNAPAYSRRDL